MSDVETKKPAKWNRADFQAKNDHRYKTVSGDRCVYCLEKAVLLDHVPALYSVFKNGAEPQCKVPSCFACNKKLGTYESNNASDRIYHAIGGHSPKDAVACVVAAISFRSIEDWAEFIRDAPQNGQDVILGLRFIAGYQSGRSRRIAEMLGETFSWNEGEPELSHDGEPALPKTET